MLTALEVLVEKRITGFPVVDDDWNLVESFFSPFCAPCAFFFIFPLSTYYGSELPKSDDILVEGTGEGVFSLSSVSLRILQKLSTLFFLSFF